MFRKDAASAPKLKAKGAETRKLVPILGVLCRKLLDSTGELDSAVVACMSLLLQCYAALDVDPYDPKLMEREVRRFALQYVSLRDYYADNIQLASEAEVAPPPAPLTELYMPEGHLVAIEIKISEELLQPW